MSQEKNQIDHDGTLISNFHGPALEENKFCGLSHAVCFVMQPELTNPVGEGTEQTFLQRRYTNGQQIYEKMLNITNQ